ncbi:hypothetical protein SDC9_38617 [bioreactor metagenome]|uniref:Uncharacterized protein n=1 Tax=bioreactor metagenome TaxID=1076179 RepID=A0A644VMF7_9ZZZZ
MPPPEELFEEFLKGAGFLTVHQDAVSRNSTDAVALHFFVKCVPADTQ